MINKNIIRNKIAFFLIGFFHNSLVNTLYNAILDIIVQTTGNLITGYIDTYSKSSISSSYEYNITDAGSEHSSFKNHGINHETRKKPFCSSIPAPLTILALACPSLIARIVHLFGFSEIRVNYKLSLLIVLQTTGIILTGAAINAYTLFIGLVLVAFSFGFANTTYLLLTSEYGGLNGTRSFFSGYSLASLLDSFIYELFTVTLGFSAGAFILLNLTSPLFVLLSYLLILKKPKLDISHLSTDIQSSNISDTSELIPKNDITDNQITLTKTQKLKLIPRIVFFFIPGFLIYGDEYLTLNCFELLYFPQDASIASRAAQFVWFNAALNVGSFFTMVSLEFVSFKRFQYLPIVGFICATVFYLDAAKDIRLPGLLFTLMLVFIHGFADGLAIVNIYGEIDKYFQIKERNYVLSVVNCSETLGMVVASIIGLFARNKICQYY